MSATIRGRAFGALAALVLFGAVSIPADFRIVFALWFLLAGLVLCGWAYLRLRFQADDLDGWADWAELLERDKAASR